MLVPAETYNRQNMIVYPPPPSIVVGVGGIGTWVAILLAMSGCSKISIMDDDSIEQSNLARLPFAWNVVGQKKTGALTEFITNIRPDLELQTYGRANDVTLLLVEGDILFDCTDNQDVQVMLSEWCHKRGKQYIRVGYDSFHITVTSTPSGWSSDGSREGYSVTPSWVVPALIAACDGLVKATVNRELETSRDVRKNVKEE